MASPVYDLLLSLQNGLGNCVPPELRAVTFNIGGKKPGVFLKFYYDSKITEEIENHVSSSTDDVDTYSDDLVYYGYELIRLDSDNPIPIDVGFAFLRYEKILPQFERKNHAFLLGENDYPYHAIFRLDMQQALLGRVTPELRHVLVSAEPDQKKLTVHCIYDGEISELNHHLAAAIIKDSGISFPDYKMESFIERVDYPKEFDIRGKWLAYWRQEWVFKNNEKIPTIRY